MSNESDKEEKIKIMEAELICRRADNARLQGEFLGTLKGLLLSGVLSDHEKEIIQSMIKKMEADQNQKYGV